MRIAGAWRPACITSHVKSGALLLVLAILLLAGCTAPLPSRPKAPASPPALSSRPEPPSPPGPPLPKPSSTVGSSHLPHAVLADDGANGRLHLHVAPLVDGGRFTSGFGWRQHPMGGGGAHHRGLDIAAPSGTPVRAAASGTIVAVGRRGGLGRVIRIRHSAALETLYAHLSRYGGDIEVGGRVRQDEVIGYVGSSGRTSGPHLHFEVHRNGRPLDPLALPALAHGQ